MASRYAFELEEIWVITGPVFDPENPKRLRSGVKIPRAFFKILIDEVNGLPRVLAFVVPQDVKGNELPASFLTNVNEIEEQTGLDFLWELEDGLESMVESFRPVSVW